MVYKVIGLMSGSSLDGLDIAYVHLQERATSSAQAIRQWEYELVHTACYPYPEEWKRRLAAAPGLSALEYQRLHVEYGRYMGEMVLGFVEEFGLQYRVQLIASHGHTVFHDPARRMTAQVGDGAALAAVTRINVVSDLRAMDMALGGQGAPIVPIGERLMLPGYDYFLNLGGIANISAHGKRGRGAGTGEAMAGKMDMGEATRGKMDPGEATTGKMDSGEATTGKMDPGAAIGGRTGEDFVALDVCPANRVLNMLAELGGRPFDEGGMMAAGGRVDERLLERLNALPYYGMGYPKSLANEFGTETVYPMVREGMDAGTAGGGMPGTGRMQGTGGTGMQGTGMREAGKILEIADGLRTYVEHIAVQVKRAVEGLGGGMGSGMDGTGDADPGVDEKGGDLDPGEDKKGGADPAKGAKGGTTMADNGAAGRMLVTGGGAHNGFLVERLRVLLAPLGVEVVVPDGDARGLIDYKEALVMALIGVLRWREERNVLGSVTGASRDSIGGAVWIGQEG